MSVVAVIAARMSSSRFPGKVLADFGGKPVLQHVIERVKASSVDKYVVAVPYVGHILDTSDRAAELWRWLNDNGHPCWWDEMIDEENVLERVCGAADDHGASLVVRANSDCPLLDPQSIDLLLARQAITQAEYTGFIHADRTPAIQTPIGMPEVIKMETLHEQADHVDQCRQHVTVPFYTPRTVRVSWLELPPERRDERNAVDTPEDLERLCQGLRSVA